MTSVPPPAPSLREFFVAFALIALCGFGGVLAWSRRMLVEERRWMSADEFNDAYALCQFLPGPNVVNLSVVFGRRIRGPSGAVVALVGLLAPPFIIVLLVSLLYARLGDSAALQRALLAMAAAAAGLVIAAGIKLLRSRGRHPLSWLFAALAFGAVGLARWPLPWVLAALGLVSMAAAWLSLPVEAAE
jgi:chromate transporter